MALPSVTTLGVTTLGVGTQYHVRLADKSVIFRFDVSNLTDENYWLSSNGMVATNAAGRTFKISATIDF